MPQGKPVSSFFPPSLLYKKSLPCLVSLKAGLALTPGLPARAWPGFSSPPQPPFASCWLRKGKEKVSWGCSRKTRPWFFSRDEASMEWSGEELWGGQREKQREGGNSAR